VLDFAARQAFCPYSTKFSYGPFNPFFLSRNPQIFTVAPLAADEGRQVVNNL
jgi:hypothetical protein